MSTAARSAAVRISLKALSASSSHSPRLAGNKARAGLNGNPACEVRVSKVARRQQMNPVVEVAEAMMWRRASAFSQVIQGESNEGERRPPPTRAAGKLQYRAPRRSERGGGRREGRGPGGGEACITQQNSSTRRKAQSEVASRHLA